MCLVNEELSCSFKMNAPLPLQISLPWAEQQVQSAKSMFETISVIQTLAGQSPLGEITLNLVTVPLIVDITDCPTISNLTS